MLVLVVQGLSCSEVLSGCVLRLPIWIGSFPFFAVGVCVFVCCSVCVLLHLPLVWFFLLLCVLRSRVLILWVFWLSWV